MTTLPNPVLNPASERLRRLRREHGLERGGLARLSGVRQGDILKFEEGDRTALTSLELARLSAALDTDPSYFQDEPLSEDTCAVYKLSAENRPDCGADFSVQFSRPLTEEQKHILSGILRKTLYRLTVEAPPQWDARTAVMHSLQLFKNASGVAWRFVDACTAAAPAAGTIVF